MGEDGYNWGSGSIDAQMIPSLYAEGLCGVVYRQEEDDEFCQLLDDTGGNPDGQSIATEHGFADDGKGKLSIPFIYGQRAYPNMWPGPAQQVGDCVSHSAVNACAASYAVECLAVGKPDPITGKAEKLPGEEEGLTATGEKNGTFSSCTAYHHRGRDSHGWSIQAAARVMLTKSGLVICKNYPNIAGGLDLTKYSGRSASRWGSTPPPEDVVEMTSQHLFRTATKLTTWEEWRAYLANGYGLGTDGGENFARQLDDHGVTRRRGNAAHSMACLGYDDRDETKKLYGSALVMIQNSWGNFYEGPKQIRDSPHSIPSGAFWARTSELTRNGKPTRRAVAFCSADGFGRRTLKDLDPQWS